MMRRYFVFYKIETNIIITSVYYYLDNHDIYSAYFEPN